MAAHGYVIIAPNRRGLPGYGSEWNERISGDWTGQCMKDYLSAIDDAVANLPFVDKDRLGCVGASFGGFSVYYLAGHHDKRFKAFIAHVALSTWKACTRIPRKLGSATGSMMTLIGIPTLLIMPVAPTPIVPISSLTSGIRLFFAFMARKIIVSMPIRAWERSMRLA